MLCTYILFNTQTMLFDLYSIYTVDDIYTNIKPMIVSIYLPTYRVRVGQLRSWKWSSLPLNAQLCEPLAVLNGSVGSPAQPTLQCIEPGTFWCRSVFRYKFSAPPPFQLVSCLRSTPVPLRWPSISTSREMALGSQHSISGKCATRLAGGGAAHPHPRGCGGSVLTQVTHRSFHPVNSCKLQAEKRKSIYLLSGK